MPTTKQTKDANLMDELLMDYEIPCFPAIGQLIEGTVVNKRKNCILVDLFNGAYTGIISGKEIKDSLNSAKDMSIGDTISAVILESENEDGFVVLSLKASSQQKAWDRFYKIHENDDTLTIKPKEANKGGLLVETDGITGFLPVSQLSPINYPRVNNTDTALILQKLQRLIGKEFQVKIIAIDKETNKLIFSEKAVQSEQRKKVLQNLKVGQKITGKISGIVKFGIFVTWDGLEGLVHISEIEWGHVASPDNYGSVGNTIEALVIGVDKDKISLSIKQLSKDPWIEAAQKIKMGQILSGKINRMTEFGAFMEIDEQINGLIHLSEMTKADGTEPKHADEVVKIGDNVTARVIAIDTKEHRIGLSMKLQDDKKEKSEKVETEQEDAKNDEKATKKKKKEE